MCHENDARPPAPPGDPVPVESAGDLRLTAPDGNVFLAHQATPRSGGRAAVVVLPDMRGLHDFYRDLARRFAEAGITALAIDYYGRIARDDNRGEGFDGFAHVQRLRPEHTAADVRAAIGHLAAERYETIFTVGFCVGGAISWRQSAIDARVAGAAGFYGRPAECRALIPCMRAPLLVLAAGADVLTPAEEAHGFDRELTEAGVPHTFVMYEDAPHSFFDGGLPDQVEACADAWRQLLTFLSAHGAGRNE
jgi:carboxymethylenebutenolidase